MVQKNSGDKMLISGTVQNLLLPNNDCCIFSVAFLLMNIFSHMDISIVLTTIKTVTARVEVKCIFNCFFLIVHNRVHRNKKRKCKLEFQLQIHIQVICSFKFRKNILAKLFSLKDVYLYNIQNSI